MKSFMIPATILVVVAIVAIAQTTTSPQDDQAIQKVVAAFVDARNVFDARNMASLFTEDAQFTSNLGRSVEGRAAIEKLIADSLKNDISGHFMDVNVMTKSGGAWMIASYYNVRLP
jgi:ketosteroid isomerase-like protein